MFKRSKFKRTPILNLVQAPQPEFIKCSTI